MKEALTIMAGIVLTAQGTQWPFPFHLRLWKKSVLFCGLASILLMLILFLYMTGTGVFQRTLGASLLAFALVMKNDSRPHGFPVKSRRIPALLTAHIKNTEKLSGFKITSTILAFISVSKPSNSRSSHYGSEANVCLS